MFNATFGTYSFEIYDVYDDRIEIKYIAHFFMFTYLFTNLILLINMVVAMMTDTYVMIGEIKQGIYNYQILRVLPMYQISKTYGGIIALTPPLNILCLLVAPIYMFWNDKKGLQRLTKFVMLLNFSVHLVFYCAIFVTCNLIMLPFAYLKTVMAKFMLVHKRTISIVPALFYLLFGIPLLLIL